VQTCNASCQPLRNNFSALSFNEFEGLSFLSFSPTSKSFRKLFHALLAANLPPQLSVEVPQLCAHLQQQSLIPSLRFATMRPFLGLCTPCMAPMPNFTLGMNEKKSYLYLNPLSTYSLQTLRLHSLQESLDQIEKQLKLIPSSF
jgi:hypothetical protein